MNIPLITLILCSRNDTYMGNSRWRLETSNNLILLNAKNANFLGKLEILVSDWGCKFPEVIALNAAARRASGEYIGRIDNDTIVGADFFRKFDHLHKKNPTAEMDLADSFLFVERKSVPYRIRRLSLPLQLTSPFKLIIS